jgi:hypothetical protein
MDGGRSEEESTAVADVLDEPGTVLASAFFHTHDMARRVMH